YIEAAKWIKKAAEQGYVEAKFVFGMMYYNGKGTTKNYTETKRWLRKAAEQGHKEARYDLDIMGESILIRAIRWLKKQWNKKT
ncbi:MAG: sel1 repeat family protein, partial [Campylobacteraceae bacterium]|nr:sel1 repeat family protein [Campylobacteraceae bacterium]